MSSSQQPVEIPKDSNKASPTKNVKKDPPKRRASLACLACRKRKVRCDLTSSLLVDLFGNPTCSNCLTNGISCPIVESKRGKRRGTQPFQSLQLNLDASPKIRPDEYLEEVMDYSAYTPHLIYMNAYWDAGMIWDGQTFVYP